ncbi:hypothetical protein ACVTMO_03260 [Pseudomonas segetis]|uniref:hypothetical protein n=1 Tax=Pseudomonas segetis TaxID=298908 RepID=UPI000B795320|nr:hypothetical protein [Pseudomonas segetis]
MLKSLSALTMLLCACLSVVACSSAALDQDQHCDMVFMQPERPAVTYDRYSRDGVSRHVLRHEVPAAGPELMNDC